MGTIKIYMIKLTEDIKYYHEYPDSKIVFLDSIVLIKKMN